MKSKILIALTISIILFSCKKNEVDFDPLKPNAITNVTQPYKNIATIIITTAKNNNDFRLITIVVRDKCKLTKLIFYDPC